MKVGIAKLREALTKLKGVPAKYKCYKGSMQIRKGVCKAEGGLVWSFLLVDLVVKLKTVFS